MDKQQQDFSNWPTKPEACQQAGISERTLERVTSRNEVRTTTRRIPGRKPLKLYHPEDVERIRQSFLPAEAVRIPTKKAATKRQRREVADTPIEKKIFLSVDEAVSYSGLPRPLVRELCRQGQVYAVKRGRWYISRKSLEQLGEAEAKPSLLLPEPDKIGRGEFDGVNGVNQSA